MTQFTGDALLVKPNISNPFVDSSAADIQEVVVESDLEEQSSHLPTQPKQTSTQVINQVVENQVLETRSLEVATIESQLQKPESVSALDDTSSKPAQSNQQGQLHEPESAGSANDWSINKNAMLNAVQPRLDKPTGVGPAPLSINANEQRLPVTPLLDNEHDTLDKNTVPEVLVQTDMGSLTDPERIDAFGHQEQTTDEKKSSDKNITITIGRVIVKAPPLQHSESPKRKSRSGVMTLDDYLSRRLPGQSK